MTSSREVSLVVPALTLAYGAQLALAQTHAATVVWWAVVLWGLAAALWLRPAFRGARRPMLDVAVPDHAVRRSWAFAAGGLGLATFILAGGHRYTPALLTVWVASVAAGWRALDGGPATSGAGRRWTLAAPSRATLGLIAIVVLGAALRFYQLDAIPREMTSDHVEKLLDVTDVLRGERPTFFPRNTGREPFQFYYTAALMTLTGLPTSHLALKVGTAVAGVVTLIFVYLLAREIGGRETGLWAALLMAIARWPIALSRAGLRFPFAPLFASMTLYPLVRGLVAQRRRDFLWAGLALAAGLHGYTSFRFMPPLVLLLVGLWWILSPPAARPRLLRNGLALGAIALLGTMPLLRYAIDVPQVFWYRSGTRMVPAEGLAPGALALVLAKGITTAALMFNYTADAVWALNIPGAPALSPMLAALFGLGLVMVVARAVRGDRWSWLLLVAWGMMLLPSALSLAFPNENPSLVRAAIGAPVVMLIAAQSLVLIRSAAVRCWPGPPGRWLAAAVLVIVLIATALPELHGYFVKFRASYARSATNPSEVAETLRAAQRDGVPAENLWVKAYPYWLDHRAVSLETFGDFRWANVASKVEDLASAETTMRRAGTADRPAVWIFHVDDRDFAAALRARYAEGTLVRHPSPIPGRDFMVFTVPAS